ncbi:MAG: homoserine O-acetyltransferase [Candidatus Melainabacteria bacterium]|nr:homoserine O-acetyltransferase [Candidatus Melainabacteria bacterium]
MSASTATQYFRFNTTQSDGGEGFWLDACRDGQAQPLSSITLAYETYGQANADRSNAILICHALTGDAHVAAHSAEDRAGWWQNLVGPGKAFDTNRYWVICSNVLGGCQGSTGPSSINPATGSPYGSTFPAIGIADMVRAQRQLMRHLGVQRWHTVAGGSMGGFQALVWARDYPQCVERVIALGSTARLSTQALAFNAVGRQAIVQDPGFCAGNYYPTGAEDALPPTLEQRGSSRPTTKNDTPRTNGGTRPDFGSGPLLGLQVARQLAHITYLSAELLAQKFGRTPLLSANDNTPSAKELACPWQQPLFTVESYLAHQGNRFLERFDANSYLVLTHALDTYDLAHGFSSLTAAFSPAKVRFLVLDFSSDWLFPPQESQALAEALVQAGQTVKHHTIQTHRGHDAFLLETEALQDYIKPFLNGYLPHKTPKISQKAGLTEQGLHWPRTAVNHWHSLACAAL